MKKSLVKTNKCSLIFFKVALGVIGVGIILFVMNDFLIPKIHSTAFGSTSDLSVIKIGEVRPLVGLARFFCEVQGGSYQQFDSYDEAEDVFWECGPFYLPEEDGKFPVAGKPVIYLYPEKKTEITLTMDYEPGFSSTYPSYRDGWNVTVDPSGKIIDSYDGKEYSYLFWEGNPDKDLSFDLTTGFIVKGEDTAIFLQDSLKTLGLTPKEYNEFIVYWLPKMEHNPYNLIHFASKDEYENKAVLTVSPQYDSILRVFMVFKPLAEPVQVIPQQLPIFNRKGFAIVEWGGTEL